MSLLAACSSPFPATPSSVAIEVPQAFAAASSGANERITTGWLSSLQDPALAAVVREALARNPNLQAAAANLRGAREGAIIGRATRLPSVSGSAGGNLTNFDGQTDESFSLSLNASWEPDVWGRLRDLDAASYADFQSAVADFRSARLSLAVNTAQSWCNLVTAEKQLALDQQTLRSFEKNFRIIERGYKAGILDPLDVNFGRNNIASAKRNLRGSELQRNEAARALESLLGRYPAAGSYAAADLPAVPARLRAGLPANLIERRPDLAAQRATLFATAKRADAAQKNLLPNLRLSLSSGTSSPRLQELLDFDQLVTSLGASIAQTFYQGGALTAQARQARARTDAQVQVYLQDVLTAFREVESSLDTAQALADQEVFLRQEIKVATLAEQFTEEALIEGTADRGGTEVLNLLEAQRRAVGARAALISLRNRQVQNHLDLLLALGGSI